MSCASLISSLDMYLHIFLFSLLIYQLSPVHMHASRSHLAVKRLPLVLFSTLSLILLFSLCPILHRCPDKESSFIIFVPAGNSPITLHFSFCLLLPPFLQSFNLTMGTTWSYCDNDNNLSYWCSKQSFVVIFLVLYNDGVFVYSILQLCHCRQFWLSFLSS